MSALKLFRNVADYYAIVGSCCIPCKSVLDVSCLMYGPNPIGRDTKLATSLHIVTNWDVPRTFRDTFFISCQSSRMVNLRPIRINSQHSEPMYHSRYTHICLTVTVIQIEGLPLLGTAQWTQWVVAVIALTSAIFHYVRRQPDSV